MSWATHHSKSERYASLAELAVRNGGLQGSLELYKRAAAEEALALSCLSKRKTQTRGITAVRVVALWLNAGNLRQARRVADQLVGEGSLPDFAVTQLHAMLIGNKVLLGAPPKGPAGGVNLVVGAKPSALLTTAQAQLTQLLTTAPAQLTQLTPNSNSSAVGLGDINNAILAQFLSPPSPSPNAIPWWTAMTSDALRPVVLSADIGNAVVTFKQGLTMSYLPAGGTSYYALLAGNIVDSGTVYPIINAVIYKSVPAASK
jgi:hypothetical protein